MTVKLYQEWILDWDHKLRAKGRHILLLQDNFSWHKPLMALQISVLNILSQTLLHTSSQWTKALFNASKLITALPSYSAQSTNMTPWQHHQKSTTLTNLKPCTLLSMLGLKLTHLQSSIAGRGLGISQRWPTHHSPNWQSPFPCLLLW